VRRQEKEDKGQGEVVHFDRSSDSLTCFTACVVVLEKHSVLGAWFCRIRNFSKVENIRNFDSNTTDKEVRFPCAAKPLRRGTSITATFARFTVPSSHLPYRPRRRECLCFPNDGRYVAPDGCDARRYVASPDAAFEVPKGDNGRRKNEKNKLDNVGIIPSY
jgi:hypothetical protein